MRKEDKTCEYCGNQYNTPYNVTREYWNRRRFCSPECKFSGMKGEGRSTFGRPMASIENRFWSKVDKNGDGGCWVWTGAKESMGYGYLANTRRQGMKTAHRLSYEINIGPIPAGMCICHRCDNPPCVNPDHLFLGTRGDNNRDKEQKGRGNQLHGEAHPKSKLTASQVREIRELRSSGLVQQVIADRFGISQNAVSQITRGLSRRYELDGE